MLHLSKLSIVLVVLMNLSGTKAVDGRIAAATLISLAVVAVLARLGYQPLGDRRQSWMVLVAEHRDALTRRYRQLVRINAYGFEETDKWHDELERFRRSVGLGLESRLIAPFDRAVTRRVRSWAEGDAEATLSLTETTMTPEDYEHHCAELLRRGGWEAEVTGMPGDQGVDILAERGDISLAVQCKLLFSRPVGNKAVQEAHAAADYAEASYAAVVTNADFTRSAEALAQKLGVLLLHHSDLPALDLRPSR
jgi:restriction system protein